MWDILLFKKGGVHTEKNNTKMLEARDEVDQKFQKILDTGWDITRWYEQIFDNFDRNTEVSYSLLAHVWEKTITQDSGMK